MNRREIKHKLKSVRRAKLNIQAYSEELENLRSLATKATPSYSMSPGGGGFSNDKIPNIVGKCLEVEELLKGEIAKHSEIFIEVHNMIQAVEDPTLQTLLNLRYLNFEKWETIADDMCFSLQHVYYLHAAALDELIKLNSKADEPLLGEDKSK